MKRTIAALLVAVSSISLAQQEDVLRIAVVTEPTSLDPITTNNIPSRVVFMQIHDGLVTYGQDLSIQPALAESWDISDDGTTYTFHIRPGVSFHNGDPLTSADAAYAITTSQDPSLQSQWLGILSGVADIQTPDDQTLVVQLEEPDASFLDQIVYLGIPNSSVHAAIGADAYAINPVGTGPFSFGSWVRGERVVLEANPDYWVAAPNVGRVEFRAIPERAVAAIELEAGGVHMAQSLAADDLIRLQDHAGITIESVPTLSYYYVAINQHSGPLADPLVRRALQYAIPMDQFVDTIFQGIGAVRAYSSFAPTNLAFDADLVADYPSYDPETARALLAEAGYPNGFSTTIYTPTDSNRRQLGELMQAALSQVGITATVSPVEFGTLLPLTYSGEAPLWILGWTNGVDPNNYIFEMFHSDPAAWEVDGVTFNSVRYDNPEFDAMVEEARRITDMEERLAIYREAARIVFLDDVAHLPAYHQTSTMAWLDTVNDVVVDPNSGILLVTPYNNVSLGGGQ